MSGLAQLPPAEARRLLVLAAMSVRARPVTREPVAIIETHGLPIRDEDADAVISAVTHLLLAQKRRWREHPEEAASGPLVVGLDDIAQHRSTCPTCSARAAIQVQRDSLTPLPAPSLFEDFEWGGPTTQYLGQTDRSKLWKDKLVSMGRRDACRERAAHLHGRLLSSVAETWWHWDPFPLDRLSGPRRDHGLQACWL